MPGALDGIKVLDFSRVLAGPWCSMTLGDLGAEVWKIEHPEGGDDTRKWAPPNIGGVTSYYLCANRNKKGLAVDLKDPRGLNIAHQLAQRADIVVENFLPASAEKLGLDYPSLSRLNPKLVHCTISGYGMTGLAANKPGYDFVMQAESGLMSLTGEPDGDPMRFGVAVVDLISGMNAVQAILAALYHRERSGQGQHVNVSLYDCGVQTLANAGSAYLNTGENPMRHGNAHATVVPYEMFQTADGRVAVAIGNDAQFERFCQIVRDDELTARSDDFKTNHLRAVNRENLIAIMRRILRTKPSQDWVMLLTEAQIPVGEIKQLSDVFQSDMATDRNIVVEADYQGVGSIKMVRSPLHFSETPVNRTDAPPTLGQHTVEILSQELNLSTSELDALRDSGVVGIA